MSAQPEVLRLACEYADAVAAHRLESLYGTSKAYTLEKALERDEAYEALAAEQRRLHAENAAKDALLRQAWAVIRWQCFGECRTEGVEGLPTPSEVDLAIREHLNKSKQ